MTLQGKKIAILAENLYDDRELWYPLIRMREEGAEVHVVAPAKGATYKSKHGMEVVSDVAVAETRPDDYAAVIIPGGYSPDLMRRTPAMVQFVRGAFDQGKVVAAICHAGWMLVSAGVWRGKTMTSFFMP